MTDRCTELCELIGNNVTDEDVLSFLETGKNVKIDKVLSILEAAENNDNPMDDVLSILYKELKAVLEPKEKEESSHNCNCNCCGGGCHKDIPVPEAFNPSINIGKSAEIIVSDFLKLGLIVTIVDVVEGTEQYVVKFGPDQESVTYIGFDDVEVIDDEEEDDIDGEDEDNIDEEEDDIDDVIEIQLKGEDESLGFCHFSITREKIVIIFSKDELDETPTVIELDLEDGDFAMIYNAIINENGPALVEYIINVAKQETVSSTLLSLQEKLDENIALIDEGKHLSAELVKEGIALENALREQE